LLKTAIEQSNESVMIMTAQLDPPGPQIVYVNSAFTKMTGYTPEEVIGKTPRILDGPKTNRAVLDQLRKDCAAGKVFHGETIKYRKDGSEFHLEWTAGPVRDERGEVTHLVATQRDVTERQRIEEELRRSEEEFRSLFELSTIGMAQVSRDYKFLRVNRKFCQMLGYSEQELLRLTFLDVTHPDDREISVAQAAACFAGEMAESNFEKRYVRKDGDVIWALVNWTFIPDAEGRPQRTVTSIQDITERKLAGEALRANEAQLRAILDNSAAVVFVKDLDGHYLRVNRWYEVLYGVTEAELKGKSDYDMYSKEIADALRANDREAIAAKRPLQFEEQVLLVDGPHHYVVSKFPLNDESGRPYAVCGIATDITKRKRAEEALRLSEERLNMALQAGDIGTFDWDVRADVVVWTERLSSMFGLPPDKTRGAYETWRERVHPEDLPVCEASIRETCEKGLPHWHAEYRIVPGDTGEPRWIDTHSRIFYDERGAPLRAIGASMEITERKRAEQALRESEALNRAILGSLTAHAAVLDGDGNIIAVNEAWKRSALEKNGAPLAEGVGINYLDACRGAQKAGDGKAAEALEGVRTLKRTRSLSLPVCAPNNPSAASLCRKNSSLVDDALRRCQNTAYR
jgi:PAS domain S-box-containing protein